VDECAPLLVREQKLLSEVLTELRKLLPFSLLGLDTDNDMNETAKGVLKLFLRPTAVPRSAYQPGGRFLYNLRVMHEDC
jgi:hypothetical protein